MAGSAGRGVYPRVSVKVPDWPSESDQVPVMLWPSGAIVPDSFDE